MKDNTLDLESASYFDNIQSYFKNPFVFASLLST